MAFNSAVVAVACALMLLCASGANGFILKRTPRELGGQESGSTQRCNIGSICAFQTYDIDSQDTLDFLTTCECPSGTECLPHYNNLATGVYNLRCKLRR